MSIIYLIINYICTRKLIIYVILLIHYHLIHYIGLIIILITVSNLSARSLKGEGVSHLY